MAKEQATRDHGQYIRIKEDYTERTANCLWKVEKQMMK